MKPTTYFIINEQLKNRIDTFSDLIASHLELVIEAENGADISTNHVKDAKEKIKKYMAKRNEMKEALIDFEESVNWDATKEEK